MFERYTEQAAFGGRAGGHQWVYRQGWSGANCARSGKFLKALFGEGNPSGHAAIFTFNYDVMQGNFGRNARRMESSAAVDQVRRGTSLFDAIHFAGAGTGASRGPACDRAGYRRRQHHQLRTFKDALQSAQRADAVMYPVVVMPIENDAGRNTGGEHALQTIAHDTGGRWLHATLNELDTAFAEILRDLRAQYMLGYYPRALPKDAPAFHPVRVELQRRDLQAQTRAGYYGDELR